MDTLANNVTLKSGLKKGKQLKTVKKKIEKISNPADCVTSPRRVSKNKKLSKTDKLTTNILKKNLKNIENVNSSKLNKKTDKPLKKVLKSKELKEVKQTKNKDSKRTLLKTKEKKDDVVKVEKKRKNNETKAISHKSKKIKREDSTDNKNSLIVVPDSQLSLKQVKKGVSAVLKLASDETSAEKSLMADEKLPIFLQVCCIKIPKTPTRQLRILLPHSLVSLDDDDVALIVKDLKKGRRTDYEPTVNHFQQLLEEHKCRQIKAIIPMNKIKTEYDQFELKRNLLNSYDYFLIDGRISGHVARLLGKTFNKKRKLPVSIRMGSKDLKHEIDHALKKTSMQLNSNGDTHIVQIGTSSMSEHQIVENIAAVCKSLAKNYPGGWLNIRALRIKTPKNLGIPIYMTMKNKNEVDAPDVKPKRPKAYKTYEDELTTIPGNATVTVSPDGTVTLNKEQLIEEEFEDTTVTLPPDTRLKSKKKLEVAEEDEDEDEDDDDNDIDEDENEED